MTGDGIELVDATRELLDAACDDEARLGALLGAGIAAHWVDFPDALARTRFTDASVRSIDAHTLAESNASTRVLEKLGFDHVAVVTDPDEGPIWRWRLKRQAWCEDR